MKNNKIDSEILDDNYFPKEKKSFPIIETINSFLKIIGYTLLNSFIFICSIILFSIVLAPILFSRSDPSRNLEIFFILFLAFTPFLYYFYREIKNKNLLETNWKTWVCIFSLIPFTYLTIFTFGILNFRGW